MQRHLPVLDASKAPPSSEKDAELVEIQLGHLCNNRCVFCSSGQATADGQALPIELQPVLDALHQAKSIRARKVTFLGGEPTLQRAFLPALAHAVSLGFEEIEIFTNGVKAARRSFVDEVAGLGTVSWRFSIQGADEASHDRAVEKPGAWKRICAAMDNVRAVGHRLTANACINEHSYRSLPKYVEVARRFGLSQLHIDVVRPSSAGRRTDAYLGEIMPQHAEMAPFFDEMLTRFEAWDPGFDVNVGNFPYCVLPQWAHRIHHGGMNTLTLASDLDNDLSPKDKYAAQHADKVHGAGCDRCLFRSQCSGVFDAYARIHGTEDLQPLDLDGLRARDPQRNAFALHAAPILEAARAAVDPATVRTRSAGPRTAVLEAEHVELTVHGDSAADRLPTRCLVVGRVAGLVLSVRARRSQTVAATVVTPSDQGAAVAELDRLREAFAAHGDVAPRATWVAEFLGAKCLARGRAIIRRLLASVDGDHEPDPDWPGVFVAVNEAPEGPIRVHFWVTIEGRVGIDVSRWTPKWDRFAHARGLLIGRPPVR